MERRLKIIAKKQYKKDYVKAIKKGLDVEKINSIITKLSKGEILESKYRDHRLSGKYTGCRECHIEPDWLLIYSIDNTKLILYLVRNGSHSDLFK